MTVMGKISTAITPVGLLLASVICAYILAKVANSIVSISSGILLAMITLILIKKKSPIVRATIFLGALIIAAVPFVYASDKQIQSLEDAEICGMAVSVSPYSIKLINLTINKNRFLKDLRVSLNKSESLLFDVKELEYICLQGDFKFYKTTFGDAVSIDSGEVIYRFVLFQIYKDSLADFLIHPIDYSLGQDSKILKAIVLGVKDDLEKEDKEMYRKLGLMHLLVASGANIMLIVALINRFFLLLAAWLHAIPKVLIGIVSLTIVTSYLLLVGLEGSLSRAFFFFLIQLISQITYREVQFLHKILLSTVLMLLTFPALVFSISFYLSLYAVFAIYFSQIYSEYLYIERDASKAILTTFIVPLLMFIPTSYLFAEANLLSLISNFLIVPIAEILVITGFIYIILLSILNLFGLSELLNFFTQIMKSLIETLEFANNAVLYFFDDYNLLLNIRIDNMQFLIINIVLILFMIYINYCNLQRRYAAISI